MGWPSWLVATLFFPGALAGAAQSPPLPKELESPPLIVGVVIDEGGISPADLQRSKDLVLELLQALPEGSEMSIASFSGDQRIVLPSTSDEALIARSLAAFKSGAPGVALPDGLFDVVQYLAGREATTRAVLLVSAGRVREGDLQFEDPLNAATDRQIRIFCLAVGPGDGKLLRRIAKLTGGEYVRLEVADASILGQAIVPRRGAAKVAVREEDPSPSPARGGARSSAGLLGAAAIFFSLGGMLLLGLIVLLVRKLGAPARQDKAISERPPLAPPPSPDPPARTSSPEDETILEKTLVVNADPTLRALSGPGAGKNFPLLASGPTSLGRSRRNDIVVPEDAASAQHCRIDREGDSYVLHDLGSTNGSWVNGVRAERAVLQHGDRLKVGETVFMVSLFGDRP